VSRDTSSNKADIHQSSEFNLNNEGRGGEWKGFQGDVKNAALKEGNEAKTRTH